MNEMSEEERRYFEELLKLVTPTDKNYDFLLRVLWDKEFYSLINYDENRAKDGVQLRTEFGFDKILFGPCRCLEVLISLARRCEFELSDSHIPSNAKAVFWEFIHNLELDYYSKDNWMSDAVYFEIDEILNKWLERGYSVNGIGGIFPLKRPKKNQRRVELWYQMMEYLIEKGAI